MFLASTMEAWAMVGTLLLLWAPLHWGLTSKDLVELRRWIRKQMEPTADATSDVRKEARVEEGLGVAMVDGPFCRGLL